MIKTRMLKINFLLAVLLIELVITLLILLTAATDLSAFLIGSLWVGLPLIWATTSAILKRLGKPHSTTLPISGAVLGICAIFFYADVIFRPSSSTAGLAFAFIPFYQLVIMLVVIFIAAIMKNR